MGRGRGHTGAWETGSRSSIPLCQRPAPQGFCPSGRPSAGLDRPLLQLTVTTWRQVCSLQVPCYRVRTRDLRHLVVPLASLCV